MLINFLFGLGCLISLFPALVRAQTQTQPASVTAIYADGPVWYRPSAKTPWKPINFGNLPMMLSPTGEVKLTKQAVLVLGSSTPKPVTLWDTAGIVRLNMLSAIRTDDASTVLADYFRYLWYNLSHRHETIDSYAQGYMKRKGVVSRDGGCPPPLMRMPDYGAAIASDTAIRFTWKPEPGTTRYTVAVYDHFAASANTLYTTQTTDTTLNFTLDKPFLEKEVTYYWSAFPTEKPNCTRYTFTLVKAETYQQLDARIAALQPRFSSPAMAAFLKAALYEANHYYPEAYRSYFQAHRLAPANRLYRDGYALFLARRGLTTEANRLHPNPR
ncbi:tetratricopeptide repeat protein [Spirosoma areae]